MSSANTPMMAMFERMREIGTRLGRVHPAVGWGTVCGGGGDYGSAGGGFESGSGIAFGALLNGSGVGSVLFV